MLQDILITVAGAGFFFVFCAASSVGFGLIEKIGFVVTLIGISAGWIICFILAKASFGTTMPEIEAHLARTRLLLSVGKLAFVVACAGAVTAFAGCSWRVWSKRRDIFPFLYKG